MFYLPYFTFLQAQFKIQWFWLDNDLNKFNSSSMTDDQFCLTFTAQKKKFSVKDLFSKCE